jgi:hypothetical protein
MQIGYHVQAAKPAKGIPVVRLVLKERLLSALEVILGGILGILRIPEDGINLAAKQSSSESTGS